MHGTAIRVHQVGCCRRITRFRLAQQFGNALLARVVFEVAVFRDDVERADTNDLHLFLLSVRFGHQVIEARDLAGLHDFLLQQAPEPLDVFDRREAARAGHLVAEFEQEPGAIRILDIR